MNWLTVSSTLEKLYQQKQWTIKSQIGYKSYFSYYVHLDRLP